MRNKILAVAVLLLAVLAMAQTFGPPQMGFAGPVATSTGQCAIPAAHSASVCPVEAPLGTITYYTWSGTAWTNGTQGPAGPAGSQGVAGAQGPQGIQGIPGPVQSFGSFKCPAGVSGSSGISGGPGCVETTP